jgi:hypothetical protein
VSLKVALDAVQEIEGLVATGSSLQGEMQKMPVQECSDESELCKPNGANL